MRIQLEMCANTRDLGGIITKHGKIKSKKLIRSGKLFYATENDIAILESEYQLKRIIDFRNNHEIKRTPDPIFDYVENIHIPILEEHYLTLANAKEKNIHAPDIEYLKHSIEEMKFDVEAISIKEYPKLLSNPYSKEQYKRFLNVLLNEVHGATLYHCSAGKDRVGVGTVLLLGALGVIKEDIIQDYMNTNIYLQKRINHYIDLCKTAGYDNHYLSQIPSLVGVRLSYIQSIFKTIEEKYPSIEDYLIHELDFDINKQKQLQKIYCE